MASTPILRTPGIAVVALCVLVLAGTVAFLLSVPDPVTQRGLPTVPVIGCPADGQAGPVAAPEDGSAEFSIPAEAASQLAYYMTFGYGVLAPRN